MSGLSTCIYGASVSYTYDSLNRLTKADYGGGVEISYTYDAAGNRLTYSDVENSVFSPTRVVAWGGFGGSGQTAVSAGLRNVVAIAAGNAYSLALRADGTVVAWVENRYGQTTVPPDTLNNVVALATGVDHSLALRADGTVVAWGVNSHGQTTVPLALNNVVAVAAGWYYSLALQADGAVIAWGDNSYGKIAVPGGLSNVVAVAAGRAHSLALRADSTVAAWGDNNGGQINVPAGLNNVVAVAAGGAHSLALRADGTVVAWGDNSSGQIAVPAALVNVVAVAAGRAHSLALRADGTVAAWGYNYYGELNVPIGLSNVVAVAVGEDHNLVLSGKLPPFLNRPLFAQTLFAGETTTLTANATASQPCFFQWQMGGTNLLGETNAALVLPNVRLSQAGSYSVIATNNYGYVTSSSALLTVVPLVINTQPVSQMGFVGGAVNFSVYCQSVLPLTYHWRLGGTNLPGATSSSLELSNLSLAQTGSYSVVVSNSAGAVISSNAFLTVVPFVITTPPQNQQVVLSGTMGFSVECQSFLPLTYQWRFKGTNLPGATSSSLGLTNVTLGQEGGYTVIVSNSAGSVLSAKGALTIVSVAAWGDNESGQTNVPAGLNNAVAVASGGGHNLALRADGTVAAWGNNYYGQTTVPTGLSNVVAVAGSADYSLALREDGTVVSWGASYWDLRTRPAELSNVVAVAAGVSSFDNNEQAESDGLALRSDGTVVAWGANHFGAMTVPANLNNVVAMAAGGAYNLALRADGTVVAWGGSEYDDLPEPVPAGLNNVVAIASGGFRHSLALRFDGTVVAWGNNSYGVPAGLRNVVAVAVGNAHSLALRSDGTMIAWGANYEGQTTVPSLVLPIGGIACGSYHSLAAVAVGPPFIISRLANRSVSVGGTVFFRVEANGAWPLHYQWRRNGVVLPGHTNAVLQLTDFNASEAGDYSVIVSNHLGVATIPSARLSVNFEAVQTALDNGLPWSSEVSAQGWFAQTTETHDGVDAAQSGAITDSQFSWLNSSVTGPGTLTFWWKVSSEPDYDFLEFYVDGVLQPGSISGEVDWQKRTNSISVGSHALRWRYVKDISDTFGQDAGWLDEVHFTPPLIPPQFGAGLSASNGTFTLRLTGSLGAKVVVENSFDLLTWTPAQTNTLPVGGLGLSMPMTTNRQQFFRARIPQP